MVAVGAGQGLPGGIAKWKIENGKWKMKYGGEGALVSVGADALGGPGYFMHHENSKGECDSLLNRFAEQNILNQTVIHF
jgi:hypothetical protein